MQHGPTRDPRGFIPHQDGVRLGEVRHMCPECGWPPRSDCHVCFGVGDVSEAQLAVWVQRRNATA